MTAKHMSKYKVLFTFKNDESAFAIESLWAMKEHEYYRIDNIPFMVSNIALYDLVSVEEDEGALYFEALIEASGHSVIQLVIFDEESVISVAKQLETFGCHWEGSHVKKLISIDIPKDVDYKPIKAFLRQGEVSGIWTFKEACLSHHL
jgi:hypothetical protein